MPRSKMDVAEFNRLKKIEEKYLQLMDRGMMKPFVEDFTAIVMTYLAHVPFNTWPEKMKFCFEVSAEKHKIGADLYKRNLPL